MSKLYCEITESARRTRPTARAHTAGTVSVKNWGHAVETRMIDNGGGGADILEITIRDLNTGRVKTIFRGRIETAYTI